MKEFTNNYEAPLLGELTDSLHINVDEIPDYVRDELAAATLDLIRDILRQPGGREMLDRKTEERKKRLLDKDISAGQGVDYDAEFTVPQRSGHPIGHIIANAGC